MSQLFGVAVKEVTPGPGQYDPVPVVTTRTVRILPLPHLRRLQADDENTGSGAAATKERSPTIGEQLPPLQPLNLPSPRSTRTTNFGAAVARSERLLLGVDLGDVARRPAPGAYHRPDAGIAGRDRSARPPLAMERINFRSPRALPRSRSKSPRRV